MANSGTFSLKVQKLLENLLFLKNFLKTFLWTTRMQFWHPLPNFFCPESKNFSVKKRKRLKNQINSKKVLSVCFPEHEKLRFRKPYRKIFAKSPKLLSPSDNNSSLKARKLLGNRSSFNTFHFVKTFLWTTRMHFSHRLLKFFARSPIYCAKSTKLSTNHHFFQLFSPQIVSLDTQIEVLETLP